MIFLVLVFKCFFKMNNAYKVLFFVKFIMILAFFLVFILIFIVFKNFKFFISKVLF